MSLASSNFLLKNLLEFIPTLAKSEVKHWAGEAVLAHQGSEGTQSTLLFLIPQCSVLQPMFLSQMLK